MSVLGIDQITYGAADLPRCRQFFLDWGLTLVEEAAQELVFESLNGCRVVVYGEVIAFDTPEAVRANPRVQEAYLGSSVADAQAGGH